MFKSLSINKAVLGSLVWIVVNSACAATQMTTCPSIAMLKNFDGDYVETMPLAFDQKTGSATMSVIQKRTFGEEDASFANYGKLVFIMSGIVEPLGSDAEETAMTLLDAMQADSDTPYLHAIEGSNTLIPICSYSLPGQENVHAVVLQDLNETDDSDE